MHATLAVKYRPKEFRDVSSQKSITKILERQLELRDLKNAYLFTGPSGTGKTTIARILANRINEGVGLPIEIDGASNNGVDNVRRIIQDAKERAIDGKYKIYIIDECHMITIQGWNAFLKIIEEPPMFTIFMFCTTDPQKIPGTIINRVQRFNLTKINTEEIRERLSFVCEQENYSNYEETIDYISKISDGGMRDALAYLEKVAGYSLDININNALEVLGNYSYRSFFDLTNKIVDADEKEVINIIDDFHSSGKDLKLFVDSYLDFVFDLTKYTLFRSFDVIKIPASMQEDIDYSISFEGSLEYFKWLLDKVLEIKNAIKGDSNLKTTISIMFLQIVRGH